MWKIRAGNLFDGLMWHLWWRPAGIQRLPPPDVTPPFQDNRAGIVLLSVQIGAGSRDFVCM